MQQPPYQSYEQQPYQGYGQPQQGYAQPQQQVVIVQQPASSVIPATMPQNVREWHSDLCGCCEDCGVCCYAYFCHPCFMCSLAGRMGENECGPFFCGRLFEIPMRTKLRTMHGIKGSICKDICCGTFCEFCVVTQMMREIKHITGH
jgi:Cys-rich protein (TIGR01571 family)